MNPMKLTRRLLLEVAALSALGWWGWNQATSWRRVVAKAKPSWYSEEERDRFLNGVFELQPP